MNAKDIQQMRRSRARQIQRTRLGGADRIIFDREPDDLWEQYAHVYENGLGTNLHDMPTTQPHEAYLDGTWRFVGIIDLDSGEVVVPDGPRPIEEVRRREAS
jgi:hypothetical protein